MIRKLIVLSLLLAGTSARAQAPLPLDIPTLQLSYGGSVKAIQIASDGAVIIGGEFATVEGVARSNIARIRPDGTLDPQWNPGADAGVYALAIDNQGALIVGGEFGTIGAVKRSHLAKLQVGGQGAVDPTWNPNVDSTGVFALDADSSGSVYVAGFFGSVNGIFRNGLAKLSASSGVVDPTWTPAPAQNYNFYVLKADNHGSVFVGGYFSRLGGQSRQNLAKLSATGSGDADRFWNPNVDGAVNALALDGAGHLFIGGTFGNAGGVYGGGLAKLSASGTGAADSTWKPAGVGLAYTYTLALDGHGGLYAGGDLDTANVGHYHFVKLSTTGTGPVIRAWTTDAGDTVRTLAVNAAGEVYVGGQFNTLGTQSRVGFGVVDKSGTVLQPVNVGNATPGSVTALARQLDGGVIVGGSFTVANGLGRYNLARIAPDGTFDMDWDPGRGSAWDNNPRIETLATNVSGDVFVSGGFTVMGGQSRTHLAKLSGSGSGDAVGSWDAGLISSSLITAIVPAANGSVFIAGGFTWIAGQPWPYIAKLSDSSGELDTSWNPAPDDGPLAMALIDDDLYVGGAFSHIGGQAHNHVAKLAASGSGAADSAWAADVDEPVYFLALDNSRALYIGGDFETIDGQARHHIGKLTAAGSVDPNWSSGVTTVSCLTVGTDDYLYVGGPFIAIHGETRTGLARLSRSTGDLNIDWNPILGVDSFGGPNVLALLLEPDDSLLIGGQFDSVDMRARTGFARLEPDSIFQDGFGDLVGEVAVSSGE